MPDRRRFAVVATPLLALISVAAAILLPSGAAPAAAQSAGPTVVCFEITVGWRICAASAVAPAEGALAQNDLTGCQPRAPAGGRSDDVADLGLEDCGLPSTTLSYGAPTTTGSVTDDGSYAFLTDPDDLTTAITTYEGLRTGLRDGTTIGLVMHQNDGDGASHEAFYDLVEANDVVEWREAADCWMRYVIREVHADPTGDPPRKLLTLQIYSHADTGCSGTLGPTGTRTFTWTPESIRTGTIQTFFTHGAFVVVPEGWTGTRPTVTSLPMIDTPWPPDPIPAPDLGDGWQGGIDHDSYTDALYIRFSRGNERVSGYIYRLRAWPRDIISHSNNPGPRTARNEWGVLDGRPVEIATPGLGVTSHFVSDVAVYVYDPATGLLYVILVEFNPPPGADPIEAAIDLVRKFLLAAHASSCQPRAPAGGRSNDSADLGLEDCGLPSTTLTYGAPVTTGSVTDVGDYAFLTDPDDLTTLVTTYEGLRDGSTTGLVIHQSDSGGTSQADFYALVEAGDLMEWREADDCFVRYEVTEVKADPAGTAPRKQLAIEWMTYAFTGCTGAISPTATASFAWGDLPDLGGASLTAPVVHGPFQILPEGWTGERVPWTRHDPPAHNRDNERYTTDPAVVRTYPDWREPDLPDHWVLAYARMDAEDLPYGYVSVWLQEAGVGTGRVQIAGGFLWGRNGISEAVEGRGLNETRVIAGRPAEISYSHDSPSSVSLIVYDQATEAAYSIRTSNRIFRGENLDALIDLARSLFEPPNAP